jgi:hypothetical protein
MFSEILVKRLRTKICAHDGLLSSVSRNSSIQAHIGKLCSVYLTGAAVDRFGAAVLCDQNLGKRVVDLSPLLVQSTEIGSSGAQSRSITQLVLLCSVNRLGIRWIMDRLIDPYSKAEKGKELWDLFVLWIKTFFQDLDRSVREESNYIGVTTLSTLRQYQMALALIGPIVAAIARNGFFEGDLELFRLIVHALSAALSKISKHCIDQCGSEAVCVCNFIADTFVAVFDVFDGRLVIYITLCAYSLLKLNVI